MSIITEIMERFVVDLSLLLFFVAVSAAYAPLGFNTLALLPLVGPFIRRLLPDQQRHLGEHPGHRGGGPMGHSGRGSYFDATVHLADGRSFRDVTADAVAGLIRRLGDGA